MKTNLMERSPMTDDMMNLRSLVEKSADADLLREMIGFAAEKLMALEVGTKTGAGYGAWLHGEAVAAGMVMAAELSALMGHVKKTDVERVRALLRRAGLPVVGPALAPERMLELMAVDKKAAKGKTRFVLLQSIGRAELRGDVDEALVRKAIVAAAQ